MPSLMKPLRIVIDLKSITDKRILASHNNLLNHSAAKGALGTIETLAQVFDLYLVTKYSSINTEELDRWLRAATIDKCFRNIITIDETHQKLRDFVLQNNISVTIITDVEMLNDVKDVSLAYWFSQVHTKDIYDGIQKVNNWYEILKDVTKYAMVDEYDFRHNKKKH